MAIQKMVNARALFSATAIVCLAGCGGSVVIPSSYDNYNSKEGTFALDYPAGWEADGGGKRGPVWAKFTSGSAQIRVNATTTASLIGDISSGGGLGGDADPEFAPVQSAHEFNQMTAQEDFGGYKEDGPPQPFRCKLGDARISEFTASGAFGGQQRGYRMTVLGRDKGVSVTCVCKDSDWAKLEPVYKKVLASVSRGVAKR